MKKFFICGVLVFLFIFAFPVNKIIAQDQYDLIFKNIRWFDGYSLQPSATVCIKNGMIERIITRKQNDKTRAITIIDGTGKTLMPGLINAHVHLLGNKEYLREAAQAGVLTVLDLFHPSKETLRQYKDSAHFASYFSAGICATAPKGHGTQYGVAIPTIIKAEQADSFVKARIQEGSDYIKIIVESGQKGQLPSLNDATLSALIKACKKYNKVSVVHISRASDAMKVFRAGADGLAHIWYRDSIPISDKDLDILAQRPFFIVPTLIVKEALLETIKKSGTSATWMDMPDTYQEVYRLYKKGITILAGTDPPNVGINYGTDIYKEINSFVKAGLPLSDALRTATSAPANAFHLTDRGMIAKGKRADLLLVNDNFLNGTLEINSIIGIWKSGVRIK